MNHFGLKVILLMTLISLWSIWCTLWIVAPEHLALLISLFVFNTTLMFVFLFKPIKKIFQNKRTQLSRWVQEVIAMTLILAILGLVNYLGYKFLPVYDFSLRQNFTLSDQTKNVLRSLDEKMEFILFANKEELPVFVSFLKLFKIYRSDIEIQLVDIESQPTMAAQFDVNESGIIVAKYKGKKTQFKLIDELSMLNGLLKIISDKKTVMGFIQGHQEGSCEDSTKLGLSDLCQMLRAQQIEVQNLDLIKLKSIPPEMDVVVIAGPQQDFLEQELSKLTTYLEQGGSLFVALSPALKSSKLNPLNSVLEKWGIKVLNQIVLDRLASIDGQEASIPVVDRYHPQHPLTKKFQQKTLFPLSAPLILSSPIYERVNVVSLAESNSFPASWGENNLDELAKGQATFKNGEDTKGPISLSMISERLSEQLNEKDTRLAVVGSSMMLLNGYFTQLGNKDYILNLLAWLQHSEILISLNRPLIKEPPVILSQIHLDVIYYISVFVLPFIFFGVGILIYVYRKKL